MFIELPKVNSSSKYFINVNKIQMVCKAYLNGVGEVDDQTNICFGDEDFIIVGMPYGDVIDIINNVVE